MPPAAALVADVLTSVNGDGDGPGDSDGGDAADAEEADNDDASPASAWSPPPDMADIFMSQVRLCSLVASSGFRILPSPPQPMPSCGIQEVRQRQ